MASTHPDGSRVGALSCTVSKGIGGLGSKEGKELGGGQHRKEACKGGRQGSSFFAKTSGKV